MPRVPLEPRGEIDTLTLKQADFRHSLSAERKNSTDELE
jgi:hypothetical protein